MPVVTISPNFVGQLGTLKTENLYIANASWLEAIRAWNIPNGNGWAGSPFDIFGIGFAYDRTDINLQYKLAADTAAAGGTVIDILSANTQVDYLAMQERAFRVRHMSPIRCKLHAAARRRGHGTFAGVFDTVVQHVINVMASAGP